MKFAVAALLALPAVAAFQAPRPAFASTSQLYSTVVTGFEGKAATSFEEDLALTLQIILDHDKRSTTVSKDQFVSQMREVAKIEKDPVKTAPVDISIPYDAAAKNAFDASDKKMAYPDFKIKYEADAVALVKSKQPVDISIPYDAAAKNAFDASDKKMAYAAFKTKYEADAVAMVKSKQQPAEQAAPKAAAAPAAAEVADISIPYDAAAKNAYEASDKKIEYPDFKTKYEADAVADVIAKQNN
jgi:hypothetical protein